MSEKRPVILMAVLLVLVAGYVGKQFWMGNVEAAEAAPAPAALDGDNAISGLRVEPDKNGIWFADADYFFNGRPSQAHCRWTLQQAAVPLPEETSATANAGEHAAVWCGQLSRGKHHLHFELIRPNEVGPTTTHGLNVVMFAGSPGAPIARSHTDRQIDWPDMMTYSNMRQIAGKSSADIIAAAAKEIDTGDCCSMEHAKQMLEGVITRDPAADGAFIELARYTMKSNWSPEGLHQADTLLQSALRIKPDDVNAKILMGYVQAHQGRFKEAQALFTEASKSNPPNLWLWANWGEAYALQGQTASAIEKYREAITRAPTHDTYDRARQDAYTKLIAILEARRDFPSMEALYKQQAADYGSGNCAGVAHASFELLQMADAAAAIAIARPAATIRCNRDVSARDVMGMAFYTQWNADADSATGQAALNQARVYLPSGMRAMYLLAGSDRTLAAARRLKHGNESVDALDNNYQSALGQALERHELPTARRLLGLGARTDVLVGPHQMPVALIPVTLDDIDGVRLMQQSGVDYDTLRFEGMTAVELARRLGRQDLLNVLARRANAV